MAPDGAHIAFGDPICPELAGIVAKAGTAAKVVTKSGAQYNHVTTAVGYASSSAGPVHFGLGHDAQADVVEIRWLSGQVDQIKDLAVNQLNVIQEGGKVLSSAPLPQFKTRGKVKA